MTWAHWGKGFHSYSISTQFFERYFCLVFHNQSWNFAIFFVRNLKLVYTTPLIHCPPAELTSVQFDARDVFLWLIFLFQNNSHVGILCIYSTLHNNNDNLKKKHLQACSLFHLWKFEWLKRVPINAKYVYNNSVQQQLLFTNDYSLMLCQITLFYNVEKLKQHSAFWQNNPL